MRGTKWASLARHVTLAAIDASREPRGIPSDLQATVIGGSLNAVREALLKPRRYSPRTQTNGTFVDGFAKARSAIVPSGLH